MHELGQCSSSVYLPCQSTLFHFFTIPGCGWVVQMRQVCLLANSDEIYLQHGLHCQPGYSLPPETVDKIIESSFLDLWPASRPLHLAVR